MLIDWLVNVIYLGLLVSWQPAAWAVSLLEVGVFLIAGIIALRRNVAVVTFSPDIIALLLIVSCGPLQALTGSTASSFQTWNATLQWLTLAAVYLVARTLLTSRSARSRFLAMQVWAGSALAVLSIILFFTTPHKIFWMFESRYGAFGPFVYKNHLAVFIELILPIACYKMISDQHRRLLYAGLYAALFACMIGSLSRAGVAIAVAETLAIVAVSAMRGSLPMSTFRNLGIPTVILLILFTLMVGWEGIWSRFQEQNSFAMRNQLSYSTIEMVKAKPLTGFGLGTWRTVYPEFATFDIARVANEAHNDWLQWASEGGVGFALVVLFFAVYVSRFAWSHLWGIGVPAVFLHCLVDYPTRNAAIASLLFLMAGALAATAVPKRDDRTDAGPEWRVLSVRTAD